MGNGVENVKVKADSLARDHMANERTFLSWIRTSIGIMAFGFVIEKFALFIKEISLLLGNSSSPILPKEVPSLEGYSSSFGVILVCIGALISLLAFIKFKRTEKWIEDNTYRPSPLLNTMLALLVLLIGAFLVIYLSNSI